MMRLPWKPRKETYEAAIRKIDQQERDLEKLRAARKAMQKLLADTLEVKKEAGNGNH